jgi:hypothetical protein
MENLEICSSGFLVLTENRKSFLNTESLDLNHVILSVIESHTMICRIRIFVVAIGFPLLFIGPHGIEINGAIGKLAKLFHELSTLFTFMLFVRVFFSYSQIKLCAGQNKLDLTILFYLIDAICAARTFMIMAFFVRSFFFYKDSFLCLPLIILDACLFPSIYNYLLAKVFGFQTISGEGLVACLFAIISFLSFQFIIRRLVIASGFIIDCIISILLLFFFHSKISVL